MWKFADPKLNTGAQGIDSDASDCLAHLGSGWKFADPKENQKHIVQSEGSLPAASKPEDLSLPKSDFVPGEVVSEDILDGMGDSELKTLAANLGLAHIPESREALVAEIQKKTGGQKKGKK